MQKMLKLHFLKVHGVVQCYQLSASGDAARLPSAFEHVLEKVIFSGLADHSQDHP
jgi:hypothetical protein